MLPRMISAPPTPITSTCIAPVVNSMPLWNRPIAL